MLQKITFLKFYLLLFLFFLFIYLFIYKSALMMAEAVCWNMLALKMNCLV